METAKIERLGVKAVSFCDGPHGVRADGNNAGAVAFPCLSALGATWNEELSYKMGTALANECIL